MVAASGGGLDAGGLDGGLDAGGLDGGGLELLPTVMSRTIVTVMSPGFTVSVQSAHAPVPPPARAAARRPPSRLLALTDTVAL
jgi:hypothetical protein